MTWDGDRVVLDGQVVAELSSSSSAHPSRRWCWLVRRPELEGWEAGGRTHSRDEAVAETEGALAELGVRAR